MIDIHQAITATLTQLIKYHLFNSQITLAGKSVLSLKPVKQKFPLNLILTHGDVISELDEEEREEFFRLKKVQGKKKRDAAKREAANAERLATGQAKVFAKPNNLLEQPEDDLLFS